MIRRIIRDRLLEMGGKLFPKTLTDLRFLKHFGRKIDWKNPKDYNEKIHWLKFYSDTSLWTTLADKYAVRKFVEDRIGKEYLIPLYGVWDSPTDIDFSTLPDSFILKANHGAGYNLIVKDKSQIDINQIKKRLRIWLKKNYGLKEAEPHYLGIKRKIIAEALLEESSEFSSSLIDYKIFCFNGNIIGTYCCFNRSNFSADIEWHDLEWNFKPEWSKFTDHYRNGGGIIPKPKNYERMLSVASELSKGFPQVRVDLYNIDGKIYFGEMTFICGGGYNTDYSTEILNIMGEMTILPQSKK